MQKIFTIGYTIPTFDDGRVDFYDEISLMDADILLISADAFEPRGHWVNFTTSDGGCYDVDASKTYKKNIYRLRKEIEDQLASGKTVFIFLTKRDEYVLSTGVSVEKRNLHSYHIYTATNYDFLPIDLGNLTSASGKHVEFVGNPIFKNFYDKFKEYLEYQLYLENPKDAQIVFTGKDKGKILGAIYKFKNGNLVVLPYLEYDRKKLTERSKVDKKTYWTKQASEFGNILVKTLLDIDSNLHKEGDKTPPPDWINHKDFQLMQEMSLQKKAEEVSKEIERLMKQKRDILDQIEQETRLKDLLFEKGKALENAINLALGILGYKSENYNDGNLELDHVINSPEGDRFIGEAEGKDNSAINIDKFRQLMTNIQEDVQRDEVTTPAIGILFGNGFRFTKPWERAEQFTAKCINTAKSSNCVLVKTTELFRVAKYIKESKDDAFAKKCRDVIKSGVGTTVQFPDTPPVGN